MNMTLSIGEPPWQDDEILASIDCFREIHQQRPITDNRGGMGLPHLFATWFMLRRLQPAVIIESGIWKGLGTWLLEQACPDATLFAIDPNLSKREYVSKKATYFEIDFSEIDWSSIDRDNTVVFFDDHQNAYTRLMQCHWFGFRQVIFEDNYPAGCGDFYSLRHAFENAGFGHVSAEAKARKYRSLSSKLARRLTPLMNRFLATSTSAIPQYCRDQVAPNAFDAFFLRKNLAVYYEFPPLFCPSDLPGHQEQSPFLHFKPPLLQPEDRTSYPELYEERNRYNFICYTALK